MLAQTYLLKPRQVISLSVKGSVLSKKRLSATEDPRAFLFGITRQALGLCLVGQDSGSLDSALSWHENRDRELAEWLIAMAPRRAAEGLEVRV